MGIKAKLSLFACSALLLLTPGVVQPMAGEQPTTEPLEAPQVLSEENGPTPVSAATLGRTLGEQLAALERAHGIRILLHPAVSMAEQVANDIDDLPPDRALRLLLRGYDYFLQYGAEEKDGTHRLQRIWVFPRNEGDRLRIVPDHVPEVAPEPVPREHAAELRDAMARSTEEAQSVIARGLYYEDENVRHNTLETALQEGLPVSRSLLESVFLHDESEVMRAAAFEALILQSESESIDVSPIILLAQQDPSPLVQSRALALREALDAPVASPEPEQEPIDE